MTGNLKEIVETLLAIKDIFDNKVNETFIFDASKSCLVLKTESREFKLKVGAVEKWQVRDVFGLSFAEAMMEMLRMSLKGRTFSVDAKDENHQDCEYLRFCFDGDGQTEVTYAFEIVSIE